MSSITLPAQPAARRSGSTLAALVVGLPLAAGLLALFHYGPLRGSPAFRYVEHPVQWAEVCFFCVGMAALTLRWLNLRVEHAACTLEILPRWDGKPVPASRARDLIASVDRQPDQIRGTYFARRLRAVVEFVAQRQNAAELDEQLRALGDADAVAQENSFGLIRFITWAIPILGFLGTVVGITASIAGATPEMLEQSMSSVTDGLAEAFDSTALALGLTMIQMFVSHLVERQEQALLEDVDRQTERHLAHRFQRETLDASPALEAVRISASAMSQVAEASVQKQVELWATALGEPEKRASMIYQQVQGQLTKALGQALDSTATAYAERLAAMERQTMERATLIFQELHGLAAAIRDTGREQQEALRRVTDGLAGQGDLMGKIQRDANDIVHLQAVLHQNLATLANASNFEEAVHSLTAAVHMLTARTPQVPKRKSA
jgi:biopolymer transport protein ExbB/TolQ